MPANRTTPSAHPILFGGAAQGSSNAIRMRELLTQEDSEVSPLNKKEALAIVSERIEQSLKLQGLYTPEPTGPKVKKPFHRGHPVAKPRLCLGLNDYRKVGAWYQACKGNEGGCESAVRYLTDPLEEKLIVDNPNLTPLFLILEELQPKTPAAQGSKRSRRFPITNSPLYPAACRKLVAHRCRRPALQASSPGKSAPVQGRHAAASKARSAGHSRLGGRCFSKPSTPSPLPFILQSSGDGEGRRQGRMAGADNASDGISEADPGASDGTGPVSVTVIAWYEDTDVSVLYSDATLITDSGRCLRLCDHKRRLGSHGIEQGRCLEIYEARRDAWSPVTWSDWLGPFEEASATVLVREAGLEWCPAFDVFRPTAADIPSPGTRKGKGSTAKMFDGVLF